jgi:16S rRNA (guanine(1405)-N(7))-methyltransferase
MLPDPSSPSGQRVERIAAQLSAAPKYRNVSPETLARIAAWASARYRSDKEVLKAAKRKLHQVYAAYLTPKSAARLARMTAGPDFQAACREALSLHASTAERLLILEDLYDRIFALTGAPRTVLDLACGLHPFALPWMGLSGPSPSLARSIVRYTAMDIDCELMALIGDFFSSHLPGVVVSGCRDVLVRPPDEPADLAFLLKAIPCLEQQERGASLRLLRTLRVRHAVVSFPVRSLGGRSKGMEEHYAGMAEDLLKGLDRRAEALHYPNEMFYVIELGTA